MKKLVFIMYQFHIGGCENVFMNLASSVINPVVITTVTPFYNSQLIQKLPKNVRFIKHTEIPLLRRLGFLTKSCFTIPLYILLSIIILPCYLRRILKHDNCNQFVNFSDTLSSLIITVLATKRRRAITWLHCRPRMLKKSKAYRLYVYFLEKCRFVIFICNSQRNEFIKEIYPLPISNTKVIYNPINIELIQQKAKDKISFNNHYICMVSRLDERSKDFHTPILAYSKLPTKITSEVKLIIIGDGPDREQIEKYIESLDLKECILLLGADENPYKWMAHSDIFLFSSKNEGLGVVILEALACNKYVIATDCPVGPAEIIAENDCICGTLVPIGDSDGIQNAIINYYNNSESVKCYLRNSEKRIKDFSLENFRIKVNHLFN